MPRNLRKYRHKHKPARKTRYQIGDDRPIKSHLFSFALSNPFLFWISVAAWMAIEMNLSRS